MPTRSAGLLVYRRPEVVAEAGPAATAPPPGNGHGERDGQDGARGEPDLLQVLLVHPGGPYWVRRGDGWWSIPKGEVVPGEEEIAAAEREFQEELGLPAPGGPRIPLGDVVQAGGKHVRAWAVAGELDVTGIRPGTFELEWPPRSGVVRRFPEVDRAAWWTLRQARRKLLPGQLPLLDRLVGALAR